MGEFSNFITEFIELYNEEERDKHLWELFIHSYTDETFEDFKRRKLNPEAGMPTTEELKATISKSMDILNSFNPSE